MDSVEGCIVLGVCTARTMGGFETTKCRLSGTPMPGLELLRQLQKEMV
jgi:hypothetical protein